VRECFFEKKSAACDLQQTSIGRRAGSATCDKVPLILYGETGGEQG
jgi:hypothetical protein